MYLDVEKIHAFSYVFSSSLPIEYYKVLVEKAPHLDVEKIQVLNSAPSNSLPIEYYKALLEKVGELDEKSILCLLSYGQQGSLESYKELIQKELSKFEIKKKDSLDVQGSQLFQDKIPKGGMQHKELSQPLTFQERFGAQFQEDSGQKNHVI